MASETRFNTPKENPTDTPSESSKTKNDKNISQHISITEVHFPEATTECVKASDARQEGRDKWKLRIEVLTLAGGRHLCGHNLWNVESHENGQW